MAAAIACLGAASAHASIARFIGASGALAASATFEKSGNALVVTLTNTGTSDALASADVLTGVFFDIQAVLTPLSAILAEGSAVLLGPDGGGNVGGEWAYATGLRMAPASTGISATGFGLFSQANFRGQNLQGAVPVSGLQYGIVSAQDDGSTGDKQVTKNNALIKSAVVFSLSGLPGAFDPATAISNVSFQYGTSLTDPNVLATLDLPPLPFSPSLPSLPVSPTAVPAPSALSLLAIGMLVAGRPRRRARGSAKP